MILYSGPMSMFGAKAQIALGEKGIAADVVLVPFGLRRRYDPKHPEVLRVNPKAQVPVLIDGDVEVSDSTQIFEYLETAFPDPPLWPKSVVARTAARQLEHASDEVYFPKIVRLMQTDLSASDRKSAIGAVDAYRDGLERRLADQPFLGGDFSYADIAFFMADLFGIVLGAECRDDTPRLNGWRRAVASRPAVRDVVQPMARYMTERGMLCPSFIDLSPAAGCDGDPEPAVEDGAHPAHVARRPAEQAGASNRKDMP